MELEREATLPMALARRLGRASDRISRCATASMALAILTRAPNAGAQMVCNGGPAVELTIELNPPHPGVQRRLERQLAAELGLRGIEICPLVPGRPLLAHVRVQATAPALTPAFVSITNDARSSAERELDLRILPGEARPSAIASATDELLSSLLDAAPPVVTPVERAPAPPPSGRPAASERPAQTPALARSKPSTWAVGIFGSLSRFRDRAQARGLDLGLRHWSLPRLSTTARLGLSRGDYRLPEGESLRVAGAEEAASLPNRAVYDELHAGLDLGFELSNPREPLGLTARAGARLARTELRVRYESDGSIVTFDDAFSDRSDVQLSWEVVGSAGLEARWQSRVIGVGLSLDGLLPVFSTGSANLTLADGSFTPRSGLGAHLGVELSLGVWVALDAERH